LTVNGVVLPLAKLAPVDVNPAIEIWYDVGDATEIEEGTVNDTTSVPGADARTALARVVPVGPPTAMVGCKVTVTLAGGIVPDGKPKPVTFTVVTPAWPAPGDGVGASVTVLCAYNKLAE
jgi:hypothetical protein